MLTAFVFFFGAYPELRLFLIEAGRFLFPDAPAASLQEAMGVSLVFGSACAFFFFLTGRVLAGLYSDYSAKASRLFAADLAGGASGCAAGSFLLERLGLSSLFCLIAAVLFLAAFGTARNVRSAPARGMISAGGFSFAVVLLLINLMSGRFEIRFQPNELVRDYESRQSAELLWSRWNAYSQVSLVRHRLLKPDAPENLTFSINKGMGLAPAVAYAPEAAGREPPSSGLENGLIPFLSGESPRDILVMFAGAGRDMIYIHAAAGHEARITGVELNPMLVRKALELPGLNLKEFFGLENIRMAVQEGRSFLEQDHGLYDAVLFSAAGASNAPYAGAGGYTGQYLFTREAFASVLRRLKPGGTFIVVNDNKLKILAALRLAFRDEGVEDLSDRTVIFDAIRNIPEGQPRETLLGTVNAHRLLIRQTPFTLEEIRRIEETLQQKGMAVLYRPGWSREGFELYGEVLKTPDPRTFMEALEKKTLVDMTIPEDDRPFIKNYFSEKRLLSRSFFFYLFGHNDGSFTGQDRIYAAVFRALVWLLAAALLLPWIPFLKVRQGSTAGLRLLGCLAASGLGFVFFEVALMQRLALLLGNPGDAFSLVLAAILLSLGTGGFFSQKLWAFFERRAWMLPSAAAFLLVIYAEGFGAWIHSALSLPDPLKKILAVLFVLPPGFCLGLFFPEAVRLLGLLKPEWVRWGWAVNGALMVTGSLLSLFLSAHFGFSFLFLMAAAAYLGMALLWPNLPASRA